VGLGVRSQLPEGMHIRGDFHFQIRLEFPFQAGAELIVLIHAPEQNVIDLRPANATEITRMQAQKRFSTESPVQTAVNIQLSHPGLWAPTHRPIPKATKAIIPLASECTRASLHWRIFVSVDHQRCPSYIAYAVQLLDLCVEGTTCICCGASSSDVTELHTTISNMYLM
jgi:hypothetical protein